MLPTRRLLPPVLASLAALAAASVLLGGDARSASLALAQAAAELAAAAVCIAAARHTRGDARLVWLLLGIAQAVWATTDATHGAALLSGWRVAEASPFDVAWLAYYLPLAAGIAVIYRHMRPERGWQGPMDALLLALAVASASWAFVVRPAAGHGMVGMSDAIVDGLYPTFDLALAVTLGWIVVRQRRDTPPWLRWMCAALGLQLIGGLSHLAWVLEHVDPALSAAAYVASSWCWVAAGMRRLRAPQRAWAAAHHDRPPLWIEVGAFSTGIAVVALGAASSQVELRVAGVAAATLMAVRAIGGLRVNRALLAERDRLVVTDSLTGAYNARHMQRETMRSLARASRTGEPVTAIAFDLDRFKEVNDRFGHGVGDRVLRAVAAAAAAELRLADVLCRRGGDEFVVVCPATDGRRALVVAERLRVAVSAAAQRTVPEVAVSASVGIATCPPVSAEPAVLLEEADRALYEAKRRGRNRVAALA
ncbi:MAG: diguanylate cyclase [Thermoleophilia bacterium]